MDKLENLKKEMEELKEELNKHFSDVEHLILKHKMDIFKDLVKEFDLFIDEIDDLVAIEVNGVKRDITDKDKLDLAIDKWNYIMGNIEYLEEE